MNPRPGRETSQLLTCSASSPGLRGLSSLRRYDQDQGSKHIIWLKARDATIPRTPPEVASPGLRPAKGVPYTQPSREARSSRVVLVSTSEHIAIPWSCHRTHLLLSKPFSARLFFQTWFSLYFCDTLLPEVFVCHVDRGPQSSSKSA